VSTTRGQGGRRSDERGPRSIRSVRGGVGPRSEGVARARAAAVGAFLYPRRRPTYFGAQPARVGGRRAPSQGFSGGVEGSGEQPGSTRGRVSTLSLARARRKRASSNKEEDCDSLYNSQA
jgi:hypothetical protein